MPGQFYLQFDEVVNSARSSTLRYCAALHGGHLAQTQLHPLMTLFVATFKFASCLCLTWSAMCQHQPPQDDRSSVAPLRGIAVGAISPRTPKALMG